jgi:sec-independent protein translocase protein TatA
MHLVLLVIVIVFLFGAKRLPDLAKGVGQSMKILKHEINDLTDGDRPEASGTTPPTATGVADHAPATHTQGADGAERRNT